MEFTLIIIGATIFGVLGSIHLAYTFFTDKFDPRDNVVGDQMRSTSPVLTDETTMWGAWIGFNASHSLGAIIFGVVYIVLASQYPNVLQDSNVLNLLLLVVGLAYLALAKRYWFRIPFFGILLATICFLWALLLIYT